MHVVSAGAVMQTRWRLPRPPWVLPLVVSCALVVPCFWRPIVSSVDLQSHLYNAWLVELIQSGKAPGLWIGHQNTNILVDFLLPPLMRVFGVSGAERILATAAVLLFFWGAFNFVGAVRGQTVYWIAPWLAILCYGFVFQTGLLNYYVSSGVVLWLFAMLWRGPAGWQVILAAPLLVLAYLAHPLPVLWFLGIAAYCQIAERVPARLQGLLFILSAAGLLLVRSIVVHRYYHNWKPSQLIYWTGADQALLYGWGYVLVAIAMLLFSFILLLQRENRWRSLVSIPGQAYLVTAVGILLIPTAIRASAQDAWSSYIAQRLSLLSGVLLLAVLSHSRSRKWYLPAGLLTAAVFFGLLYQNVGKAARVEAKIHELVQTLPPGQRVISYVDLDAGNGGDAGRSATARRLTQLPVVRKIGDVVTERMNPFHLLSRACIGHCFDYMNYEPSTGQFRIHAKPGNPLVVSNVEDLVRMDRGLYAAKASDLPLYVVLRCGPGLTDLCLRSLAEGQSSAMLADFVSTVQ